MGEAEANEVPPRILPSNLKYDNGNVKKRPWEIWDFSSARVSSMSTIRPTLVLSISSGTLTLVSSTSVSKITLVSNISTSVSTEVSSRHIV